MQMGSSRWGSAGGMGMRRGQPAQEIQIPRMEEFREYPRMGEMRGGGRKSWENGAARRTHVQGVLRRLRLGAAVEADEAHGLRRKERRHRQSGWQGAEGGTPPNPRDQRHRGGWERGVGCSPRFERLLPAWR